MKLNSRGPNRLRISEFTQNFWVFSFYIADFWQTFWVIWENGSNWSNLRLKMSFFALGRLKNHKVPHLHPNSTMFMPLDRLQLKIYAFSGKFNVCSKRVVLSWIKICRDFTLQTQIFTQKYRSWLRFYSEFLRKKLAAGGSASYCKPPPQHSRYWSSVSWGVPRDEGECQFSEEHASARWHECDMSCVPWHIWQAPKTRFGGSVFYAVGVLTISPTVAGCRLGGLRSNVN